MRVRLDYGGFLVHSFGDMVDEPGNVKWDGLGRDRWERMGFPFVIYR